jgi:hypothetical protein
MLHNWLECFTVSISDLLRLYFTLVTFYPPMSFVGFLFTKSLVASVLRQVWSTGYAH